MKKYDAVVVGSGCGLIIVEEALAHGQRVALVDKGSLGGTCPNTGCIPSKMLIFPADRIVEAQEAAKLGVHLEVKSVDFTAIMERMRQWVRGSQAHIREGITELKKLDYYPGEGHFVADYTLEVGGQKVKGERVFIACGTRPFVPPIKGLAETGYLTNESLLGLKKLPESVIIIGGGYIGVEYGHFLAAMGAKVTIVEMAERLVAVEEPEVSEVLRKALAQRMAIYMATQAQEVKPGGDGVQVVVQEKKGASKELTAEKLIVAVGRKSNADSLNLAATGLETDARGFIPVNQYLETKKPNIFAIGDVNGKQMFTHAANRQAATVAHNYLHNDKIAIDHSFVPHAVFSHPQIASVGLTEERARASHDIQVAWVPYSDSAAGDIMMEQETFAKIVVEKKSQRILGCHIIGPQAAILIQEVVNAMASGGNIQEINEGTHIHPAASELIQMVVNNLEGE